MRALPPQQISLDLEPRGKRGGKRKGAGRKKRLEGARIPHRPRPLLAARYPVHVVLRVLPDVSSLRGDDAYAAVNAAMRAAADARDDMRVVHFSVQGNHVHMLVEAHGSGALSRGMQGLQVRIARKLNRRLSRRGRVFDDRYYGRILKTPTEVHRGIGYVLLNRAHHLADRARSRFVSRAAPVAASIDPYSSAPFFFGFMGRGTPATLQAAGPPEAPPVFAPRSWLLQSGWKRLGPIDPSTYG